MNTTRQGRSGTRSLFSTDPAARNPLIVRIMSETMAKTGDRELRTFIHGQHHAYFSSFADRESLLESFTASVSHHVSEVAAGLTLPVLLIAGEKDEIATLPDQHK